MSPDPACGGPEDGGVVDTVVEDARWSELPALAERAFAATLRHLGHEPADFAMVVLGTDDARVAALNGRFRGRAVATNVLSWPSEERSAAQPGGAPLAPTTPDLGDVALAWETCAREAAGQGRRLEAHALHLLVHATLHLLGYDHEREADARLMERLETEILGGLGVADPYAG